MNRTRALIPAALATALLLAGCSAGSDREGGSGSAEGGECASSGSVSSAMKVDGDFGKELSLSSDVPVTTSAMERSVLIEGDGDALEAGSRAEAKLTVFNGRTGALLTNETATLHNDAESVAPWVSDSISCSVVGDRVVSVLPASDVFGEGQVASAGFEGLEEEDTLVMVFDIEKLLPALLSRAEGAAKEAPAGFPKVELAEDGAPTITIPEGEAQPGELKLATVIEGDGETVQPGDSVTVNYRGVIWRTGEEFDSSWSRGEPVTFLTDQVVEGFQKALEGQKVGSQVISLVPPASGYGPDTATKIKGAQDDDVLVFVLDILGTAHSG